MQWDVSDVELGMDAVSIISPDSVQKKTKGMRFINTLNSKNSLRKFAGRLTSPIQSEIYSSREPNCP